MSFHTVQIVGLCNIERMCSNFSDVCSISTAWSSDGRADINCLELPGVKSRRFEYQEMHFYLSTYTEFGLFVSSDVNLHLVHHRHMTGLQESKSNELL